VLVLLPLNLIGALDQAAEAFDMSRSDIIRRSLIREVTSVLRDDPLTHHSQP
jgi:predicted transcriptional regulator